MTRVPRSWSTLTSVFRHRPHYVVACDKAQLAVYVLARAAETLARLLRRVTTRKKVLVCRRAGVYYSAKMNPAKQLQGRVRADLKLAMVQRRTIEVRALRTLLAAIDDAQAVPASPEQDKYVVRSFGDPGVEVPRLDVSSDALQTLLQREQKERVDLAEAMAARGQSELSAALNEEAAVFARYLVSR